jgi:hypothetical protein
MAPSARLDSSAAGTHLTSLWAAAPWSPADLSGAPCCAHPTQVSHCVVFVPRCIAHGPLGCGAPNGGPCKEFKPLLGIAGVRTELARQASRACHGCDAPHPGLTRCATSEGVSRRRWTSRHHRPHSRYPPTSKPPRRSIRMSPRPGTTDAEISLSEVLSGGAHSREEIGGVL